jgi:hypothetical protein
MRDQLYCERSATAEPARKARQAGIVAGAGATSAVSMLAKAKTRGPTGLCEQGKIQGKFAWTTIGSGRLYLIDDLYIPMIASAVILCPFLLI